VDPFVLACPEEPMGREAFEMFVNGLVEWRRLPSPCIRAYKLRSTPEILAESDSYPLFGPVRRSLRAFGMSHIEARDIVTIAESLLLNLPDAEDALGLRGMLFDAVVVDPPAAVPERHAALLRGFHEALATILLLRFANDGGENCQLVLTRGVAESTIRAVTTLVECEPSSFAVPRALEGSVALCSSMDELHGRLDLAISWCGAECDADRVAIVGLYVARVASETATTATTRWRLGNMFLRSARALGFVHGPTEPQRRRGGGRDQAAWRRDVDHEFHLHYWGGADGIELAAVVVHRDFDIAE
jgi:hypothetical protein